MRLFISYGHGNYTVFFERFIADLKEEFEVWVDSELRLGDNWSHKIDNAISQCDLFLLIKTANAVRPDSYCYGEISFAQEMHKRIAVISLDDTATPSIVAGYQRLFMDRAINIMGEVDEEEYDDCLELLIDEIKKIDANDSPKNSRFELFTFNNKAYLEEMKTYDKIPSQISDVIDDWLKGQSVFLGVFGNAGSGKSTLSTGLYQSISNSAIHYFRYSDLKSIEGKYYLQHIVASLADSCPEFRKELQDENFENDLYSLKPKQLFRDYIIRPIERAKIQVVIILDGFDEIADKAKRKEAAEIFFSDDLRRVGSNSVIKVMVTSRNDRELKSLLASLGAVLITNYEQKTTEVIKTIVEDFFTTKGYKYTEDDFSKIYKQSGGDFLYVNFILNEIQETGEYDISKISFPMGMKGICQRYFDRLFDESYFEEIAAPALAVLISAKTPISVDELHELCSISKKDLRKLLKKMEMFVDVRNNLITFVHKSLYDWLISNEIIDKYYIDCADGRDKLCDYSIRELTGEQPSRYACEYGLLHLLENNRIDDIIMMMKKHEQSFNAVFMSFVIDLVSSHQEKTVERLFRLYCDESEKDDYLVAESLRLLVQFEKDKTAYRIISEFTDDLVKKYYSEWVGFHIAKRNNAAVLDLEKLIVPLMEKTESPIILADLRRIFADVLRENGRYEEAEENYNLALVLADDNGLENVYFDCEFALIDMLFVRGNLSSAWERMELIKERIAEGASPIESYKYHRLKGHLFHIVGNVQEALSEHNESYLIAEELHFPLKRMESANSCAEASSDLEAGRAYLEICRDIYEKNGLNKLEYGKSFYIESELLIQDGQYLTAEEAADRCMEILTEVGYAGGLAHAHLERGKARFFIKNFHAAIEDLVYAIDYYKRKKTRPRFRMEAYGFLIMAAEEIGKSKDLIKYDDIEYFDINDYPFMNELYQFATQKRRELI